MRLGLSSLGLVALLVVGCSDGTGPATRGFVAFEATVQHNPDRLQGAVTLRNYRSAPYHIEYAGLCAVALLVYADAQYTEPPVWDQLGWWFTQPGACKWPHLFATVPALGVGEILTPTIDEASILGDSLAPGTYYLAVRLYQISPRDTIMVIPAGPAEIDP